MAELVSVVIPTYNRAHCLARAIDSALAQTHAAIEVVVVDDGSTDATPALLAERYGGDRRVVVVRQDNAGVARARNRALAAASGDFVAFLDSDDVWWPWKIELQLQAFRALPGIGMVWTDMAAIDPAGTVAWPKYLRVMYGANYRWFDEARLLPDRLTLPGTAQSGAVEARSGEIYSEMMMGNLVHTSTVLLSRQRLARVGGFDEDLAGSGEDYDFHLRTCREGPVAFLDVAAIGYQIGMEDQLVRRSRPMAANFLRTLTKAVAADRDRIRLPAAMLDRSFAHAHAWLAEVLIDEGERGGARRHLLASLGYRPLQPRALAQLILCLLPPGLERALRRGRQRVKGRPKVRLPSN